MFKIFFTLIIIILFAIFFYYYEMRTFSYSYYNIENEKVTKNLKILHLSDFHGIKFGKNNKRLLNKIKKINPDIIVVTGDIVMSGYNISNSLLLMEQLTKITKTYFVRGNHDLIESNSYNLLQELKKFDVIICESKSIEFEENNIILHGLMDFLDEDFNENPIYIKNEKIKNLKKLEIDYDKYNILITHRPYDFSLFVTFNIDLTLCGHTHGGQWIFPIFGGFISPDRKIFFPEYDYGLKKINDKLMIINRGLGGKLWAIRLFNRPEIGIINIKSKL